MAKIRDTAVGSDDIDLMSIDHVRYYETTGDIGMELPYFRNNAADCVYLQMTPYEALAFAARIIHVVNTNTKAVPR